MKKIILAVSLLFAGNAMAWSSWDTGDGNTMNNPSTTQVYGSNGQYEGQATRDSNGNYQYYGNSGQYEGSATNNGNSGYNYYGNNGQYEGSSRTSNY